MLTGRNVLVATLTIAAVSLVSATWSLTSTGANELGGNSFGVRAHGLRGLFEILEELDVATERVVGPPTEALSADATLAFLGPDPDLVGVEPAYLLDIADWVRGGGRLVYAPRYGESIWLSGEQRLDDSDLPAPRSFLELMGITGVQFSVVDDAESETIEPSAPQAWVEEPEFDELFGNAFVGTEASPVHALPVHTEGVWTRFGKSVTTLAVPRYDLQVLMLGDVPSRARITMDSASDEPVALAASFAVGKGEVVVLSDQTIAQNRFVSEEDNAVLLVDLLAGEEGAVVFDEFYHGLTARGNPLVLLRRPAFTLLLVLLCATFGVYAWRHCIRLGAPLPPKEAERRSLSEYVEAMARLFAGARDRTPFLIRENRDGVLRMLRDELGLSPSKHAVADIHTILTQRDPHRAERFLASMGRLEELAAQRRPTEREALEALQRATDCL